ncbi:CamS family sex pheromone protein, partial [Bacillus altitudinis]|uniref:CamS family sex pheromone protein n=1 Tax=Bacillus altitudinis TaxID=293387 RepID=UPI001643CFA6
EIDEFERGLMGVGRESLNRNEYVLEEGEDLDEDSVVRWVGGKKRGSDVKKGEKEEKEFKKLGLNGGVGK